MKKTIITSFMALLLTGQLFAQQRDTIILNLLSPSYPSQFVFTEDGYWDETYNDTLYTFFKSQIFSLSHLIEGAGSSYGGYAWNGFTVCNSGDNNNHNDVGWLDYQWGCMAGGGIMTDAQGNIMLDYNGEVMVEKGVPYLVSYWNFAIEEEWWHLGWHWFLDAPTRSLQILLDDEDKYEAVGVFVNNHPYTYFANLYGCGLARPLNQEGDFYKLIIHGLNPDGTESGKTVTHFFAKFENGQLHQNDKWEWVDLTSLGEIGGLFCTLETTDYTHYGGPQSPMYFCMDKLQVQTKANVCTPDYKIANDHKSISVFSHSKTVYIIEETDNDLPIQSVEIYDMQGKMVYNSNGVEKIIALQVPTGFYNVLVRCRDNEQTVATKILITH